MTSIKQKLNQIRWLKEVGVAYYCSDKKDSINSWDVLTSRAGSKEKAPKEKTNREKTNKDRQSPLAAQENMSKYEQIPVKNSTETDMVLQAREIADSAADLEDLRKKLLDFDGCSLKKFANKTVFSDGNPLAKILLIGEAPGANEDLQGIPFCGESGKLLDNMLATIDVSREKNAYITNTVFWRPPGNRPPTQQEIDICRPFVEKHIALIKPEIIILVGSTAATSLLGSHEGITKIRQNSYSYINRYLKSPIHTTAIYHPAYLLRQPFQKKSAWFDLLRIKQYITLKINSL